MSAIGNYEVIVIPFSSPPNTPLDEDYFAPAGKKVLWATIQDNPSYGQLYSKIIYPIDDGDGVHVYIPGAGGYSGYVVLTVAEMGC